MIMKNTIRFYNIEDMIKELNDAIIDNKIVRVQGLQKQATYTANSFGNKHTIPATRFFTRVTAESDYHTKLYILDLDCGSAMYLDDDKRTKLLGIAEKVEEELVKKLSDAGFKVRKGVFEQE